MRRKCAYFGNPWIGMFVRTNDSVSLLPKDAPEKTVDCLEQNLKTEVLRVSVGESSIIGAYVVMNSNGIVLPNVATEKEVEELKGLGLNIYRSRSKANAHGNNICVNDKGGIINPLIPSAERKKIGDALGVELVPMRIARYSTVGSSCLAGNRGFLIHYAAEEDEVKAVEDALKVRGEEGSVNMGAGFVSLGIVGNKHGYVAGESTSAFEMGRAESALGYI